MQPTKSALVKLTVAAEREMFVVETKEVRSSDTKVESTTKLDAAVVETSAIEKVDTEMSSVEPGDNVS